MRPTTVLLTLLTALTSATPEPTVTTPLTIESRSTDLSSLYSQAVHSASVELHSLSVVAATATGAFGSTLKSEYSSLKTLWSAEKSSLSSILAGGGPTQSGGASASGSKVPTVGSGSTTSTAAAGSSGSAATPGPSSTSTGSQGAAAAVTGVPVIMGAVWMAVLAVL